MAKKTKKTTGKRTKTSKMPAGKAMNVTELVGYADETLYDALNRMSRNKISHLPVVEHGKPQRMVGFLAVHDLTGVYDAQRKMIR